MRKLNITDSDLAQMKNSSIVLHGEFDASFFDLLKTKDVNKIFVVEGRPNLDSSKIICKELLKRKLKPTVIADNMVGFLFYKELVKEVWLAYDQIDYRGAFCFIGASIIGALSKRHSVPVFCYPAKRKRKKELIGKTKDVTLFQAISIAPKETEGYVPLYEWVPGKNFVVK
ncbi:MAG: hypothetical protein P9X22_08275 [Candidatus Zapsychrus exili]|nr:hypothetical protein [Candidatus Zapsychrus exili]